jgi:hypothetical protein
MTRTSLLGFLLFALAHDVSAQSIAVTFERELPTELRWALDVRWAQDGGVYLAGGKAGVFKLPAGSPGASPLLVLDASPRGFFFNSAIAVDRQTLITSAWAGGAVKDLARDAAARKFGFAALIALDARAGKVAILGADRDAKNRWAPEGAIAWLGDVADTVSNLRPVLYSTSPGVKTVAFCSDLQLGAVRFVMDDSFVIVPGVEPGVYWYGTNGKLRKTWQTSAMGFYDRCTLDEQQAVRMASQPGHDGWYNRNVVLDSLLVLPDGIGLILRSWKENHVSWTMRVLRFDDRPAVTVTLPFRSSSPYTHLRADGHGTSLVFLFSEYGPLNKPPARIPRLIIAQYKP